MEFIEASDLSSFEMDVDSMTAPHPI